MANEPVTPEGVMGTVPEWQQRVIAERRELEAKLNRLNIYIAGPDYGKLGFEDGYLLLEQARHMQAYYGTLSLRISRFAS